MFLIKMCFYLFIHSGGCCGSTRKRTIVGGWAWAWWLVTDVQRLSLEVMTLNPMCEGVETAQGVPLTVTGVAQCKIMKVWPIQAVSPTHMTKQLFIWSDSFYHKTENASEKLPKFQTTFFSLSSSSFTIVYKSLYYLNLNSR